MKVIILKNPISKLVGKFSEIRSVQLPDGRYMIPERLLDDPDLASAVDEINAETDTTSDVELLPDNGTVTKDVIYRWTDSDVSADGDPITLVVCRKTHERTINKPSETPALFTAVPKIVKLQFESNSQQEFKDRKIDDKLIKDEKTDISNDNSKSVKSK